MGIRDWIEAAASVFTIATGALAFWIYGRKRGEIAKALRLLLNYATVESMGELRLKLERLNDLDADTESDKKEVVGLLNDIVGQLRGNKAMKERFAELLGSMEQFADQNKPLSDAKKRGLVAEIRAVLVSWHVEISNRGDRDE